MSEQHNVPDNIQAVQQWFEAFGQGDMETVLSRMADDVKWECGSAKEFLPYGGTWRGTDEIGQFFRLMDETMEFEHFEPQQYIAQGDYVVVLGRERLRPRATGRTVENHWALVFTFSDGKISRLRTYEDSAAIANALH